MLANKSEQSSDCTHTASWHPGHLPPTIRGSFRKADNDCTPTFLWSLAPALSGMMGSSEADI